MLRSYLLTQVEIDHAYRLLGIVIFVVLQHVRVARQTTAAKNKPPLLPCLWGQHKKEAKGYFACSDHERPTPQRPQAGKNLRFPG